MPSSCVIRSAASDGTVRTKKEGRLMAVPPVSRN
jgi:hypothetical protein